MVTEQLEKFIAKYEDKETDLNYNANEFKLIGEFLTDLNTLLKHIQEERATCCAKKAGKQVIVMSCRTCPYLVKNDFVPDYCGHSTSQCAKAIKNHDIIPDWCPL